MEIFDIKKHKKASLSLSMNAIVILILAITLLGLGLTFMRGLFKQITGKVSEAVSATELTNPPTEDNQLTVAPSKQDIRMDESGEFLVAFMNTENKKDCWLGIYESGSNPSGILQGSTPSEDGTPDGDIIYSMDGITMDKDQINTWTVSVFAKSTDDGGAEGTNLFTAEMTCDTYTYSKDFVVTVIP